MYNKPPHIAQLILKLFLRKDSENYRLGDLEEAYNYYVEQKGIAAANKWYWQQVFRSAPLAFNNSIFWGIIMFKNYFKVTLRNISKQKFYSTINILGLSVGLACAIFIFLWANDEYNTNGFNENLEDIYWVRTWQQYGSDREAGWGCPPAVGPALESEYPEVLKSARIENGQRKHLLQFGDKIFRERIQMADFSVFDIFSFPLVTGSTSIGKNETHVCAIDEDIAEKFFGNENPVGQSLLYENEIKLKVVAVFKKIPHNSTVSFKIILPLEFTNELYKKLYDMEGYTYTWYNCAFRNYVLMQSGFDLKKFNEKIFNRIRKEREITNLDPFLSPFKDQYLVDYNAAERIKMFLIIGVVVLMIACINFMNLTTARSINRAKEVSLRKVVGAERKNLIFQFMGESLLLTFISLLISILIVYICLPVFSDLTAKPLNVAGLFNNTMISGILIITMFTGLISGSYPALFLSSFRPSVILKGNLTSGKGGSLLRKIMVVAQFSLSISLIIYTLIQKEQINYMLEKDLGYEEENIVYYRMPENIRDNPEPVINEFLSFPEFSNVTLASRSPEGIYQNGGGFDWEGKDDQTDPLVTYLSVDERFMETMEIEITQGSDFTQTSAPNDVMVNENFARLISEGSVIGKRLSAGSLETKIVGVVKDFHYKPVYRSIGPIVILNQNSDWGHNFMLIKLAGNIDTAMDKLEEIYSKHSAGYPLEYHFLDERLENLYNRIRNVSSTFTLFTSLAIFISCLGLFGLAAFMAEQKTKEIGIRKVLGANVSRITLMLSKDFAKLVLLSNLIAWPLSYYLADLYLNDFAYKAEINLSIFVFSGLLTFVISLLTVCIQTLKASLANPADSLRSE